MDLTDLAESAHFLLDVPHRICGQHDRRGEHGGCVGCELLGLLEADGCDLGRVLDRVCLLLAVEHRGAGMHDTHGAGWSCSGCRLLADLEALHDSADPAVSHR